jgi:hypothetical protein
VITSDRKTPMPCKSPPKGRPTTLPGTAPLHFRLNQDTFSLAMLSHIVFVAFKQLALPEDWKPKTIETLRFEMIRLAGMVSRRVLWLKSVRGLSSFKFKGL